MLQRDPIDIGGTRALWQSFDILPDGSGSDIFFDAANFGFNRSSALFTLNNGLNAFALFGEAGFRLEESDVLLDTNQRDFVARVSISCSGCHAEGVLPVEDQVADFARRNPLEFSADDLAEVEALFDANRFAERLANDNSEFQAALALAGAPFRGSDPIEEVFLAFDNDLDLAAAAGDLGVTPNALLEAISTLDSTLRDVDVARVGRGAFQSTFLGNLCLLAQDQQDRPNDIDCEIAIARLDLR